MTKRDAKRSFLRVAAALALCCATGASLATPADDVFDAASIDDLRDVQRLLRDHRADAKALDPRGDTLLIVAIRADAPHVVDFLLGDRGTDLEATNGAGETALMIAAFRKNRDVVEKLLARDVEVNRVGWTALHYAASVDAGEIVALLLDHAAYIDAESPNLTTPLMMAARGPFDRLCRQLIEAGADPTPVNQRGLKASDFARRANDATLAQWLEGQTGAWRAKYGDEATRKKTVR